MAFIDDIKGFTVEQLQRLKKIELMELQELKEAGKANEENTDYIRHCEYLKDIEAVLLHKITQSSNC